MSIETAESYFAGQVSVLLEGGIDLLVFETFGEVVELEASVRAARRLSILPVVAQIAAGEDGLSFGGLTPERFAVTLLASGAIVVGVRCGAGPAVTLESVERMAEATDAPPFSSPNAGGSREVEGRRLILSSQEFLAFYVRRYVTVGVGLVGGCCGTAPVAQCESQAGGERAAGTAGFIPEPDSFHVAVSSGVP